MLLYFRNIFHMGLISTLLLTALCSTVHADTTFKLNCQDVKKINIYEVDGETAPIINVKPDECYYRVQVTLNRKAVIRLKNSAQFSNCTEFLIDGYVHTHLMRFDVDINGKILNGFVPDLKNSKIEHMYILFVELTQKDAIKTAKKICADFEPDIFPLRELKHALGIGDDYSDCQGIEAPYETAQGMINECVKRIKTGLSCEEFRLNCNPVSTDKRISPNKRPSVILPAEAASSYLKLKKKSQ